MDENIVNRIRAAKGTILDRALVTEVEAAIAELWEQSDPFNDYFHREIAPLSIPSTENGDT